MKIIHCADLHLDSKMTSNLSKEQAKERKMEILRTYSRMIEYAKNNDVKAIIIVSDCQKSGKGFYYVKSGYRFLLS